MNRFSKTPKKCFEISFVWWYWCCCRCLLFVPSAFEFNFMIWTFEKLVSEGMRNRKKKTRYRTAHYVLRATCSIECWIIDRKYDSKVRFFFCSLYFSHLCRILIFVTCTWWTMHLCRWLLIISVLYLLNPSVYASFRNNFRHKERKTRNNHDVLHLLPALLHRLIAQQDLEPFDSLVIIFIAIDNAPSFRLLLLNDLPDREEQTEQNIGCYVSFWCLISWVFMRIGSDRIVYGNW